jgi:hypothetical protein
MVKADTGLSGDGCPLSARVQKRVAFGGGGGEAGPGNGDPLELGFERKMPEDVREKTTGICIECQRTV